MIRVFRHYIPSSLVFMALAEHLWLIVCLYSGLFLRWANTRDLPLALGTHLPEAVTFATVFIVTMIAFGMYNKEYCHSKSVLLVRLFASFLFGFVLLSFVFYLYPALSIWRSALAIALGLGFIGVMALRTLYLALVDIDAFKRRILVLGAGDRAARIQQMERDGHGRGFVCAGFVALDQEEPRFDDPRVLRGNRSLAELAHDGEVEEIVVAIDDRRGNLPMEQLLECKFTGVTVTDYSTFWERETGKVDLEALHPSWLVYSDGFVGGWLQSQAKRSLDVVASLTILALTLPIMAVVAIAIRLESPGPALYRQERVGLYGRTFMLLKFRSMRDDAERDGVPQWAAVQDARITRVGRFIRHVRMDELPQLFNVLKGDMSFIGPRPERPFFVEKLREVIPLYFERHRVKPGISGWAQINYPYGASVEDAQEKFEYDLYYIKNYSLFLDIIVLLQTARVILWPEGVR